MRNHLRRNRIVGGALMVALPLLLASACGAEGGGDAGESAASTEETAAMESGAADGATDEGAAAQSATDLPPGEEGATEALNTSPRHGEWVDVPYEGAEVPIRTWAVHPERSDDAPVVIVIHEIFGLTDWIRSVADQLAAEGYIALAPDLLSGMGPDGGGTEAIGNRDDVVATIQELSSEEASARLDAVYAYAQEMPSSIGSVGTVGFCWGGSTSFSYAVAQPELDAAVVYYGSSPEGEEAYESISAPVLGLYGEDDQRVNSTIPRAREAMDALGKTYETEMYDGAGHGFLRAQGERDGANLDATEQAWPRTLDFFGEHLGS